MEPRRDSSIIPRITTAILWLLSSFVAATATAPNDNLQHNCPQTCGDVEIPYPFGIGPNCSMKGFELNCSTTKLGARKPFLSDAELLRISLSSGQARIKNRISWQCSDNKSSNLRPMDFTGTPFRFSDARNKFTTIGCHAEAYIRVANSANIYLSGCVSVCLSEASLANGSCSGIGCCRTAIPKGINYYQVWFDTNFNSSDGSNFSRCSYAVLAEKAAFKNFSTSYITTDELQKKRATPLVMDWAIGNETCQIAKRNMTSYACASDHSVCVDSLNGPGYLCSCSKGFQGNPYLRQGCQDVDECAQKDNPPCSGDCTNTQGGFFCSCPHGTHGNPNSSGACYPKEKISLATKLIFGSSIGLVVLLVISLCACIVYERKKLFTIKEKFFRQHGGRLLLEEIGKQQGMAFTIFTKEELEQATNKFDKNNILGHGGHGTVYKGILKDNRIAAIKNTKIIDETQKKEFGKEMIILSQINHKNIVKLLGCCLEVEVPMLVYEFISNGTLFQLIQGKNPRALISLQTRLQIALDSAEALAYLHSSASPPIIHGDVKSSNILLDDHLNAKVSDFGASTLTPTDETQFVTFIQGTCGYLDPEYIQTCQLTKKSDVYSFGVVLLELLTGKKALYFDGPEDEKSLSSCFLSAVKENRVWQLIDDQIKNEEVMDLIEKVVELARTCLNFSGEKRPSMKEVAEELDRLSKLKRHSWKQNEKETECLLDESTKYHTEKTTSYFSLEKKVELSIGPE